MGKVFSEVERAYLAGLIDADGAIMALIEKHKERKFKFRVRIVLKLTQKKPDILQWVKHKFLIGNVKKNRTTYDWITRDQKDIQNLLKLLLPFVKIKKRQAEIALQIIALSVLSEEDLLKSARLADALSMYNPRSRERRVNFATMIKENISPND